MAAAADAGAGVSDAVASDNWFEALRTAPSAASEGALAAATACLGHYDTDMDGVLDRAEVQRLLADLLVDVHGRPEALSDAVLDRLWGRLAGESTTRSVIDLEALHAAWGAWIGAALRPRAALLIVDVQNDFIDGTLALKACPAKQDGGAVVPVINGLRASAPYLLVVTTLDAHPADHCSFVDNVSRQKLHASTPVTAVAARAFDTVLLEGEPPVPQTLWPVHCVQGTWGHQLHRDLVTAPTDVVLLKGTRSDVDSYSAFWDNAKLSATSLHASLTKAGVTDVVVCGLAYDVCVRATVLHARELGYRTTLVEDACAGVAPEGIAAARAEMLAAGVCLTTADRVPALVRGLWRPAVLAL